MQFRRPRPWWDRRQKSIVCPTSFALPQPIPSPAKTPLPTCNHRTSPGRIVTIMAKKLLLTLALIPPLLAQEPLATHAPLPLQPLAQQGRRLQTALNYLGQPLLSPATQELN